MKTKLAFVTLAGFALFFAACSEKEDGIDSVLTTSDDIKSTELAAAPGDSCDFTATLTEDEVAGLLEMREEEKLAHDVYIYFYETYEYFVFNNISESEDAHSRAVLYLINGFGLVDPAQAEVGEFTADLYKTLYSDLTAQGSTSLADALKVGAFIEEYDIADLQRLIAETTNETILRVYGNLLRGSESHLGAFVNVLAALGEKYEPQIISEAAFAEILSQPNGKHGQGIGSDGNGGKGNNAYSGSNGTGACNSTQSISSGNQAGNRYGK